MVSVQNLGILNKMKKTLLFIIFTFSAISAQRKSIDLFYSGNFTSESYENYSSVSIWGHYLLKGEKFDLGPVLYYQWNRLSEKKEPFSDLINRSLGGGVKAAYYPFGKITVGGIFLRPAATAKIAYQFLNFVSSFSNFPTNPEKDYFYKELKNDFTFNIGIGIFLEPDEKLNFLLEIKYEFRRPELFYQINNSIGETTYQGSETVNMNSLLWSLGLRINL